MRFAPRLLILATLLLAACGDDDGAGNQTPDAQVPPDPIDVTGPLGRIDFEYALDVAAEDLSGTARSYSVAAGELPPGLTLDAAGTVSGTPERSGTWETELWGDGGCGAPQCRLVVNLVIDVAPVILLSGYGPFEGVPENPSWAAVAPLHEELIGGYDVRTLELEVLWDEAPDLYLADYDHYRPVIAIGAGVAMGETVIRLETQAVNWAYGEDYGGSVKTGEEIVPGADQYLPSTLPLADLQELLVQQGYPVALSDDAGTYLCNYLFYRIMRRVGAEGPEANRIGGFVHVPGEDVVSIVDMTAAWELMLALLADYHHSLLSKRRHVGDRPHEATVHHPPRYLRPGAYRISRSSE